MIIWIVIPESFPTIVRSTATGAINSSGKCGAVVGTTAVVLLFYVSPLLVAGAFVVAAISTFGFSFLLSRETRDSILADTL